MGVATTAVALGIGTFALWSLKSFIANVQQARRTGLPVIVHPFHTMNLFFLLTMVAYKPIIERLPFGLNKWKYLHFFYMDWAFHTRDAQFEEYGNLIITSSPGGNCLHVGDADVALQVLTRRGDFPKDIKFYAWVRFFGDSVLTTEGAQWRQHRKITSPPFSEAVNSAAWKTTLSQATTVLSAWTSTPSVKIIRDVRGVARNVLSSAGFGVEMPLVSVNTPVPSVQSKDRGQTKDDPHFGSVAPKGHTLPYGQALDWLLDHILTIFIIPAWLQRLGPAEWRQTATSYTDTGLYLSELLERERDASTSSRNTKKNLLGALVTTSDSAAKGDKLSEEDLIGNVFVFAVAGLETTAGTLQYALTHLAMRQDVQRWMCEELDTVLKGESEDPEEWDYGVVWPKLVAPLCVIYETLRHHPTFQSLPKWTSTSAQTLNYNGQVITIPPETSVFVTLSSLHHKRTYWGDQALEFHPQKWDARRMGPNEGWTLTDPVTGVKTSTTPPVEETKGIAPFCHLRTPLRGSYLPFAEGFRQCLGKNFALVEMSALLAVLFREHKCRVACKAGETQEMADARAMGVVRGSSSRLTVMMREEVELVWEKR